MEKFKEMFNESGKWILIDGELTYKEETEDDFVEISIEYDEDDKLFYVYVDTNYNHEEYEAQNANEINKKLKDTNNLLKEFGSTIKIQKLNNSLLKKI